MIQEASTSAPGTHPVPVLKHQSLNGCLLVWLRWHFASQVLHKGLHNPVVLVTHLHCSFFSTPHSLDGAGYLHAALPCERKRAACLIKAFPDALVEEGCLDFAADDFGTRPHRHGLQNCLKGVYLLRPPQADLCEQR